MFLRLQSAFWYFHLEEGFLDLVPGDFKETGKVEGRDKVGEMVGDG